MRSSKGSIRFTLYGYKSCAVPLLVEVETIVIQNLLS
jgi:hypothetical protein